MLDSLLTFQKGALYFPPFPHVKNQKEALLRMNRSRKLQLGRYDFAAFSAFTSYALCSLAVPVLMVAIGRDLNFPLDDGGMSAGGMLHLMRSVALVVALLVCGSVAGRFGKRRTMGICMLLTAAGVLVCASAPAYWILIPGILFAGFGEGVCEGVATPFMQDLHKDAPERYVNIAHAFWSVGIGLCVIVAGGLLSLGVEWRAILASTALIAIASGTLFLWKESPRSRYPEVKGGVAFSEILRSSRAIAKAPRFWICCLAMFVGAGAEFGLTFWSATYLQLNFHTGAWVAGLGTGAIALGMFLGRIVFGCFARRELLRSILLGSALATIPITLLLAFLKPGVMPDGLLFLVLFLILFLSGIGISPFWPTVQVYGVVNMPKLDSTMLYIYFSAIGVPGCGFFTWLMGFLGDRFGLTGAFLVVPASLILFSAVVFWECWILANGRKRRCRHLRAERRRARLSVASC